MSSLCDFLEAREKLAIGAAPTAEPHLFLLSHMMRIRKRPVCSCGWRGKATPDLNEAVAAWMAHIERLPPEPEIV